MNAKENYIPRLINEGLEWHAIADSIKLNCPHKEIEFQQINATGDYILDIEPDIDSVSRSLINLVNPGFDKYEILNQVKEFGMSAIPVLVTYLEKDYATRVLCDIDDLRPGTYTYRCISDISMSLIIEISGIYFLYNRQLSKLSSEERNKVIEAVKIWYQSTHHQSKVESINYFLNNFDYYHSGNKNYTAEKLAEYGDTTNAITYLKKLYKELKMPCRSSLGIAKSIIKLGGKDVGLRDCMHDIYDYKCMPDNGIRCVKHIFQNAKSHIPFEVLADIISTEKYSRYRKQGDRFIWHHIFDRSATAKKSFIKPILLELMMIDTVLKGSNIVSYNWKYKYPQYYEAGFRVCDFALLKMSEIFPSLNINVNWNDKNSIEKELVRILQSED